MESLQPLLGFAGSFAVDSDGLSGGIGLFWSEDVHLELKNYSKAHIDVRVRRKEQVQTSWRFTGFYGEPRSENRTQSWEFLRTLHGIPHDGWICMGDFNETMYAEEHFSVHARPARQMQIFCEVIDICSFQDLGWRGVPFTWDNRQQGASNVKARLDRALANNEFMQLFEYTCVKHISSTASDHCYILAELRSNAPNRWPASRRPFRYANIWQTHSQYDQLVKDSWHTGAGQNGLDGVMEALTFVQNKLGSWGDREFGNMAKKVQKLQKNLERLRAQSIGKGPSNEELSVTSQLKEALWQEEIWIKQRSRIPYIQAGDRNTQFFHARAT